MDILKTLGSIFQFEDPKMQPTPSIVRADEDEEIFINNSNRPAVMTHGPQGLFGDIYGTGSDLPSPDYRMPTPEEIAAEHRRDYAYPNPMVMAEQIAEKATTTPSGPMIPPMQNETVKDLATVVPAIDEELGSGVPEVDPNPVPQPTGDLLADLKAWRETLEDGSPDAQIADARIADMEEAIENGGDYRASQGTPEEEVGKTVRRNNRLANPTKLPGLENQGNLTEDERAAVRDAPGLAAPTTPDELPAAGEAPAAPVEVSDPNGNPVTQEAAERVAAEDPSGWEKAMSWVQRTFGINGQDLARFGLLYAGSRLAGYGHSESMSWGFQVAGEDLLSRRKIAAGILQGGKYTPESIEEYRKTGNAGALKPIAGKNGIKINSTSPSYKKGTTELVYKATDQNGNQYYVDGKGKPYYGDVWDGEDEKDAAEVRSTFESSTKEIITDLTQVGRKEDPWYTGSPERDAKVVFDTYQDYSDAQGINLDSAAVADITAGATIAAKEQYARTGTEVNSLQPFIEQQIIYRTSQEEWAQNLRNSKGEMLSPKEFGEITGVVMATVRQMDGYEEAVARTSEGAVINAIMKDLYGDYKALPPEQKKLYKGGFNDYLTQALLNPF